MHFIFHLHTSLPGPAVKKQPPDFGQDADSPVNGYVCINAVILKTHSVHSGDLYLTNCVAGRTSN